MKVLVTGIAGFLGSHLADALLEGGHEVVGCDNLSGGELANVPRGARFVQVDCLDLEGMRTLSAGCELVYHCAATAYEGLSLFSPNLVTLNVFQASVSTFVAALANGVRRIVYCSSMARYGAGEVPFVETAPAAPVDPYGVAKVAAEQVLRTLCEQHDAEFAIAVPHNIYGPRQRFDDPYRNVAAIMTNLMLQGRQPYIYGDGRQKRCLSYVDDCVGCLLKLGTLPELAGVTVNIGPDDEFVEIRELASRLASVIGFAGGAQHVAPRPGEVRLANCRADRARRLLGFAPAVSLDAGLPRLVEYVRRRGPRPFRYHLPIELCSERVPATWRERLF